MLLHVNDPALLIAKMKHGLNIMDLFTSITERSRHFKTYVYICLYIHTCLFDFNNIFIFMTSLVYQT